MDPFEEASIVPHKDGSCSLTWMERENEKATIRTRQFATRREAEAFARSLGLEPTGPEMALAMLLPTVEEAFAAGKSGDWKRTEEVAKYVLGVNPDDGDMHRLLGVAYLKQGRLDESIPELESAVRLNPSDGAAHHNLGVAYAFKGRRDDAIAAFEAAAASGAGSPVGSDLLRLLRGAAGGPADDPSVVEHTQNVVRQYFKSRRKGA
jgi:Flp pilus assembly protein TadD